MTLTITGIVYLDGCMPFVGTAIDESGMRFDVVFNETPSAQQRVALLDTIEATGVMVTSPHHGGRPAWAIDSMKMLRRETVGSVRRRQQGQGSRHASTMRP
jgi:hypothetical protein